MIHRQHSNAAGIKNDTRKKQEKFFQKSLYEMRRMAPIARSVLTRAVSLACAFLLVTATGGGWSSSLSSEALATETEQQEQAEGKGAQAAVEADSAPSQADSASWAGDAGSGDDDEAAVGSGGDEATVAGPGLDEAAGDTGTGSGTGSGSGSGSDTGTGSDGALGSGSSPDDKAALGPGPDTDDAAIAADDLAPLATLALEPLDTVGNFSVEDGILNTDYRYDSEEAHYVLTILTNTSLVISMATPGATTDDRIVVDDNVDAVLTLNGVSITTSSNYSFIPALEVGAEGSLTLTLEGDNTLNGGNNGAGIQLMTNADLTITEESNGASLTASSPSLYSSFGAAGIGAGYNTGAAGDIIIKGGTITANGNYYGGAGIGGGATNGSPNSATVHSITINGGTITANGGRYGGAGIGGGEEYSGVVYDIIIKGGTITANGGDESAGIGGGANTSAVTGDIIIDGGTITTSGNNGGADIGNGYIDSYASDVVINGGSVWAKNGTIEYGNDPTTGIVYNTVGVPVFANTLTIGLLAVGDGKPVTAGVIDGIACNNTPDAYNSVYGIGDVLTTNSGKVYLWLPDTKNDGTDVGSVGLVVDGTGYELAYARLGAQTQTLLAAPALTTVAPSGTGQDLTGNVVLTFSGAMNPDANVTVELMPPSGPAITLDAGDWSSDNTVYTTSYADLVNDTVYAIELSGFQTAIAGFILPDDNTHKFTTADEAAESEPEERDFGTAAVGYPDPPAAQAFTITNTGDAELKDVKSALIGFDAGAFEISIPLTPTTIEFPGTATISVQPVKGLAARVAPYTATLELTNDEGLLLEIPVSFTVSSYTASSSPPSKNFGTVAEGYPTPPAPQEFTIKNTGTAELVDVVANIVGADASFFSVTEPLSPPTIPYPSGTATISVQPAEDLPVRVAPYTATLKLTNTDGLALEVPLSFTVSSYKASSTPADKNFGNVAENYPTPPAAQQFTITNTGTAALRNVQATITGGGATAFSITSPLVPAVIASGSSTTVSVRPVTEMLANHDSYTANLHLTGDNGFVLNVPLTFTVSSYEATSTPADKNFGSKVVGYSTPPVAQKFTITNEGTTTLAGVSAQIVGADRKAFSISAALTPSTIAYEGTATISVRPVMGLAARSTPYTATLELTNAAGLSCTVSLTFTVISYTATSTPQDKNFGSVRVGYTPPTAQSFTLTNNGTETLTNLTAAIVGADASAFNITAALSAATLNPKDAATISVQPVSGLIPRDTAYKATLRITGANGFSLDIPVSFVVETFKITLNPPTYNFGAKEKGYAPPTHSFTITNTGSGTLHGLSIHLAGNDPTAFSLTSELSPLELTSLGLAPQATHTLAPQATHTLAPASSELASSGLAPQATHTLAPGQHITVKVHPVEGLAPRSTAYTAALRVTASDNIDHTVPLSFTVKAHGGFPDTGDTSSLVLAAIALALATLGTIATVIAIRRRKTDR
ncbi:MAG: choice-of-anchor D domain-containing protein [Coriobacteriales bacterium]|jgi:LPXTG-motif cell wall-anchored protein|nr:choice-of-anchor D domain-containing protein [Coriobacteriales bacterium]